MCLKLTYITLDTPLDIEKKKSDPVKKGVRLFTSTSPNYTTLRPRPPTHIEKWLLELETTSLCIMK